VARLLLVPIAIFTLLAGLLPLVTGLVAAWQGLTAELHDPALARALEHAALGAVLVPFLAVPLGIVGAQAVAPAARWARALVYALAVLVLLTPGPGFADIGFLWPPRPAGVVAFGCAVARGAALSLLILTPSLRARPHGLVRAAMMAGASPARAWWDAVLLPLSAPLLAAVAVSALVALSEGPAATVLEPHLEAAQAWVAPAALLLMSGSIAALSVLLRRARA
jgi:ABC-type glycerol-3-phosphate transport system permease component